MISVSACASGVCRLWVWVLLASWPPHHRPRCPVSVLWVHPLVVYLLFSFHDFVNIPWDVCCLTCSLFLWISVSLTLTTVTLVECLCTLQCKCWSLSRVWLCDPVNCSHQAPLSMEFSRQEYWSGLSFPSPGDRPHPKDRGLNPSLLHCRRILYCLQITLCLFQSTAIFAEICSSFTEPASFLNPFLFDTKSQSHLLLMRGN